MKQLATACLLCLIVGGSAAADTPDQKRLAALIAGLGSDSFSEREQAAKELEAAGPAALDALKAAVSHRDSEISGRAVRLVSMIEEQIVTSKMLAAKKVRLAVKDVTVLDAIKQLSTISGYPCEAIGNLTALGERKITLDTGEVAFWEALQQLCDKGQLTESRTTNVDVNRGVRNSYNNANRLAERTVIYLMDGREAKQLPVCHQGSVRITAFPGDRSGPREMQFVLDVAAEHRLQDFGVVGTPFLTRIVDDQEQTLSMVLPTVEPIAYVNNTNLNGIRNANVNVIVNGKVVSTNTSVVPQRSVVVRINLGEKSAKTLKEVSGKVTVQALSEPELLVKAEGILAAAGRSFTGKDGHVLHVQSVDKQTDGSYCIRLGLETPEFQDPFAGRNVKFRGNFNNVNVPYHIQNNMPKLTDVNGVEHTGEIYQQRGEYFNGQWGLAVTLVFRPTAEPARLLLRGQRTVLFSVPFTLKSVPVS